jgi:hypothetical protein
VARARGPDEGGAGEGRRGAEGTTVSDPIPRWARWILYPETCPWRPLRWLLTFLAWTWDLIAYNRWSPLYWVGRVVEWTIDVLAEAGEALTHPRRR